MSTAAHASAPGAPGKAGIHLEVVTPDKKVVAEMVDEVVLPGSQGYLGVLPGHAPLLTDLGVGELSFRRDGARHFVALAWGFAEILPERVTVLAEIAERAEEIDRERARKARDRALDRLRSRGEVDFNRAQVALERALVRLQVAAHAGPSEPA
ncbi:MAG TPA: F0F1 ATP synthase subunit epsilon [Candidatus Polarisedimenticolia bacterium]